MFVCKLLKSHRLDINLTYSKHFSILTHTHPRTHSYTPAHKHYYDNMKNIAARLISIRLGFNNFKTITDLNHWLSECLSSWFMIFCLSFKISKTADRKILCWFKCAQSFTFLLLVKKYYIQISFTRKSRLAIGILRLNHITSY